MSTFIFIYLGSEITIPCKQKEDIKQIIHRFCIKVGANKENLNFLCNGKILDENITEDKIPMNQNGTKIIIVDCNNQNNDSQDIIIKSNVIICPQCKEYASLSIDNYHLTISNCKNGHIKNINIEDFAENQKINISQIICEQCKNKNMGNAEGHLFFRCIDCKKNLCIICKSRHNPNHNIFNYYNKYYTCEEHGESFISYCFDCKCNLCFLCEDKHKNHQIQTFRNLFNEDTNKLNEGLTKFKENINIMKQIINDFVNICNKVVESYEILYNIKKDIYENINLKQRNLQNWINQKFINNQINDDIEIIINELNNNYNFAKLLNIYKQIKDPNTNNQIKEINLYKLIKSENICNQNISNEQKHQDYIIIKYKIEKNQNKINIFGEDFVRNNSNHCKIIYDNNEHELSAYINVDNIKDIKNNILEIKLIGINNITNAAHMFYNCKSLILLPDISEWNTENITSMDRMFSWCSLLSSLPDISNWNTSNVNTMNSMFSGCSSLKSLPDISKWNINKLKDIRYIFRRCSSLISLPDISKWDVSDVRFMNDMFIDCSTSIIIPTKFKK